MLDHLSPDMNYKLSLLDIFTNIKTYHHFGDEGARKREEFLQRFSEKFDTIPSNTLEESKEFFSVLFDEIIDELSPYYSIEYENKETEKEYEKAYHLKRKEESNNLIEDFKKYGNSSRFMEAYLSNKNYELYRIVNGTRNMLSDINGMAVENSANSTKTISPFYISKNSTQFIPSVRRAHSIGQFFSNIEGFKKTLDQLHSKHEEFLGYVESYEEEMKEKMITEHIRFGTTYLKEILSRIIVPVSCLEDGDLKQLCKEQGREVFVRKPEIKDFLFKGANVHIYSSHNLEDDSSYVIKPILVDPTLPTDTEDLKYHGVGIYSEYDDTSKRSCNGTIPHVIGGVLYCGADLDEFSKVIPEKLLEEIEICEKLMESINGEVEIEYSKEGLTPIIKKLKQDENTDVSSIIQKFMELDMLGKASPLTDEQERHLNNNHFKTVNYVFNRDLLITTNNKHPLGFCIFKDESGTYSAVKRIDDGTVVHKVISKTVYNESGFLAACKALELTTGLYPIFDFSKRSESRDKAIVGMASYTISE